MKVLKREGWGSSLNLDQLHACWKIQSIRLELKKILLGVAFGLMLAFVGPYGSSELQSALARVLYWVGSCVLALALSRPIALLTFSYSVKKNHPVSLAFALFSVVAALPVFLMIIVGDATIEGPEPLSWEKLVFLIERERLGPFEFFVWYLQVLFICVILFGFITYLMYRSENVHVAEAHSGPDTTYKFFKRLPVELGQKLVCLAMEDHYIRVYTERGNHLLLMRFKDALQELESYDGFQVHRSWWVSAEAIVTCEKDKRRYLLSLSNGMKVPVSKTYQDTLKEYGYL